MTSKSMKMIWRIPRAQRDVSFSSGKEKDERAIADICLWKIFWRSQKGGCRNNGFKMAPKPGLRSIGLGISTTTTLLTTSEKSWRRETSNRHWTDSLKKKKRNMTDENARLFNKRSKKLYNFLFLLFWVFKTN